MGKIRDIYKGDIVRIKYPNRFNNKRHYNRLATVLNIDDNGDCKVLIINGASFYYSIHWLEKYNGSKEPTANEKFLIKNFGKRIFAKALKSFKDRHFTTDMLFNECERLRRLQTL